MTPTVIGPATLWRGDCLELLASGKLGTIDAVISDPPYGNNYVKGRGGNPGAYRGRQTAAASRHHEPIAGNKVPFDPAPWIAFENVLLWGADHFARRIPEGRGRWLVWDKLDGIKSFDSFSDVEIAWHSRGQAARLFRFMWKGGLACRKLGENNGRRDHPTQKPVGVMSWCLEQAGIKAGMTVLDPYMGSGTTGCAALHAGARFVGVEIEAKHFETAVRRISAVHAQWA